MAADTSSAPVSAPIANVRDWPSEDAPEWAAFHFNRCWPWLEASLAIQPVQTHAREHVWEEIASGRSQIWPTPNSCCLVEINTYPSGLKAMFGWLAGGDLDELKVTCLALEKHARECGCDVFAVQGRRGWVRALEGFEDAGTTIVKVLRCPD
ncbi:hypothetical protein [Methylobacterium flocculans]|uniref:hypothetical protein n=1 Tax=Methylobacterium flocculans TaxID=2984843 RepID=UPI0021F384A3|nr:hypothetical protein [Methylobacterium sp. FF17]